MPGSTAIPERGTKQVPYGVFVFTGPRHLAGQGTDKPSFTDVRMECRTRSWPSRPDVRSPGPNPKTSRLIPGALAADRWVHPRWYQRPLWRRLGAIRQEDGQSRCPQGSDHPGRRRSHQRRFVLSGLADSRRLMKAGGLLLRGNRRPSPCAVTHFVLKPFQRAVILPVRQSPIMRR